ncbi:hypothetical protein LTR10_022450 [Elasticomyces elasticus]|uniref:SnoaL-like domain-containing protein n=1 Tax=Exophiala sideris TaxID=1016849 RepID=A0ABR0J2G6_9EURO|nr:hypothetical protein LTR10_022450 [Elasticomyces elasticus]KAK5024886.1 hypothetical protein LTS07_008264 [Exophiala sideris]KAK5031524.1 hypothetical protein LTR13_007852 [Exophiala sideris]KAK5054925.1 hypothetical protein LTR69_008493 [Exophiala sideris]KAK5179804.1 hypothetical protein LTR44_007620 [Eurotiomycetes sp. CCFEE 6388]
MASKQDIEAIFDNFAKGDLGAFFSHIDPNVDWTVKGTYCPISGHYNSAKAFQEGTAALSKTWAVPLKLVVQDILVEGNQAAVELKAVDVHCKNGLPFTNEYVWLVTFGDNKKIVKVRAYMDT